ncbi:PEP-CTERM system histidine kinase PrsK [Haliea sp. E1-2-M8]|uniref:XrtA/PEP-CTERM system histidine kinase PrsK n=1 Tax=Haliea sp. E1-2-M8 TaxID=3064706 RepID=UPI002715F3D5|nr:XrtA/PEP-CTERM system histidine kinase PrsK [Haliea sp. E1-2-M8]MDO8860438.1 PEP-CTERM system histidine kinase PrsK [Haliea sp. E1-2-M8]
MAGNIGLFTHLCASASFTLLALLLLWVWRVKPLGNALVLACTATALWAAIIGLGTLAAYPPVKLMHLSELLRNISWLNFLALLLALQADGTTGTIRGRPWRPLFLAGATLALVLVLLPLLPQVLPSWLAASYALVVLVWLVLALAGLLLIEQLYRNAAPEERWALKFLCLGLGAIFTWDFFMYSEALLFRQLNPDLLQARGLVNAVVAPLLGVAFARYGSWRVQLQVSRQAVFHTVTLMGAGMYLLGMAAIGYFLKYMGGTWGTVLQLSFLVAAGTLLASLLFSGRLRALLRVQLSKHFFSYRYDYREEWLKFTRALAGLSGDVAEGIIHTMAPLANSPAGLIWGGSEGQPLRLLAHWGMPVPEGAAEGLGNLPAWLQRTDWVIDLAEWRHTPDLYTDLELPEWLGNNPSLWLIIPLTFRDRLEGVLMLKQSKLKHSINWEDRDLLKTAGRQAASHLAQHLASQALVEARQFDAFNRLSAYVVHDLKNILAQQSLIVSNAARHRNNPAFIDDMINTVENSVARMQRLMEQMRSGVRSAAAGQVALAPLLQQVVAARDETRPVPQLELVEDARVEADSERLATVFNHLIQNAQEATPVDGRVTVNLNIDRHQAIVAIADTGRGMDADFLRQRLFRPFESTKGLTGMGIGAFESREYIRQLGGDISVESTPGAGSVFRVKLPLVADQADATADAVADAAAHSPIGQLD